MLCVEISHGLCKVVRVAYFAYKLNILMEMRSIWQSMQPKNWNVWQLIRNLVVD